MSEVVGEKPAHDPGVPRAGGDEPVRLAIFWADPRLQWPGSADEMRDALLYHVAYAPDEDALARITGANAALYFRLPESDRRAVESAISARREELRGESGGRD